MVWTCLQAMISGLGTPVTGPSGWKYTEIWLGITPFSLIQIVQ